MADRPDAPRDLTWYQDQWQELMDVLPTSAPEDVVDQVRELQISILDEEAEALEEMGLADAEEAKTVLQRIFDRLQKLRRENQALQHLQEVVNANAPDEIADSVGELRERLQTLEQQQEILADAGFEKPEYAVQALANMKEQLNELYDEKEAAERSISDTDGEDDRDTFDQLQALMAREEKLQRELGVSSPDAVIEIVEGLTTQLEDLYRNRDEESSSEPAFASASRSSSSQEKLEAEIGVSDPDALIDMVNDLTSQLDELYEGRKRLAEFDLNGADEAVEMVRSLQHQLEALYEQQDQMAKKGINGVDHALSMIESMEQQLSDLYDERQRLAREGVSLPPEVLSRLDELEKNIHALIEEKEMLQNKRDHLQTQFNELEEQVAAGDADTVTELIDRLEAQLEKAYESFDEGDPRDSSPHDEPLLAEETIAQLEELDDEALDSLPAGIFCLDDQGTIRRTNENVLQWPDVEVDDAHALIEKNFFEDVAPATKNVLFWGRFQDGVDEDEMDEQFFYTYVDQQANPTNLAVHFHRKPDQSANWILFRIV